MLDKSPPELQSEVHRLLGRCVLRLQHYERALKALLAHHELGGPMRELESRQAARVEEISDKTLGTLIKRLFDSYVVTEGTQRPVLDESKLPVDQISMSFQSRIEMTEQRRDATKAALEELVQMRNVLVHHLVDRFDLGSDGGCADAAVHLIQVYDRIEHHCDELRQWAVSMRDSRALTAFFVQSEVFVDQMVNGIDPDGTFEWRNTGIVNVLREAATRTATAGGWLTLEEAKAWINQNHPEQVPAKYGCRSWPQVLNESKCFRLQYRADDGGQRVAWYRAVD